MTIFFERIAWAVWTKTKSLEKPFTTISNFVQHEIRQICVRSAQCIKVGNGPLRNLSKYQKSNFKLKFEEIIPFFKFCSKYARERSFSRHIFSRPFCRFPFSYLLYLLFVHFLCSFTQKKKPKLFVLELRQIFYGHRAIQSKKLPNDDN